MSMRAKGEGSIYRKADGRWEGRILIGHKDDGKPIYRFATAKTQKDALRKLARLKNDYKNVSLCSDSCMTLSSWLTTWMSDYMTGTARESTLNSYQSIIDSSVCRKSLLRADFLAYMV